MSYVVTAVIAIIVGFIGGCWMGMWLAAEEPPDEWDFDMDEEEEVDFVVDVQGKEEPVVWFDKEGVERD